MRACVLALNPCIDAEWRVGQVRWEEKNEVQSERRWAGGKGVNVARWLRHLGARARLIVPLGGEPGRELADYLRGERLSAKVLPVGQNTRVNVLISTADGRQLRFNAAGPKLTGGDWRSVLAAVGRELTSPSLLILSGSLAPGLRPTAYAELGRRARRTDSKVLLDCDGEAFAKAVRSGPFLVKPNAYELAQWAGRPLDSERAIQRAARDLSTETGGWVLVSRGKGGGLLVHSGEPFFMMARPPRVQVRNTLGAGDALLAAVAWRMAQGEPPDEWLAWGVAAGTAATQCAAGGLPPVTRIRELLGAVKVARHSPVGGVP